MKSQHKPMDAINDWQIWYKQHQPVAPMDEPLVSKDSRENLHDTSNAINAALEEWRDKIQTEDDFYFDRAVNDFMDVLDEYAHELTPEQFHKAFLFAAVKAMQEEEKEYKRAKKLVDLLSNVNLIVNNEKKN